MDNTQVPSALPETETSTQALVNTTLSMVRRQHTRKYASRIATGPLRATFLLETASCEDLPTLIDLLSRAG